ncbi:hypothetical protein CHS0354_028330 [Potamilus streckersoni]|uniref:Uncharacterized protein n=1 Tax=Potamilus streckersoni TaxID=2493646 RepID=A0AAE0RUF1_9BIVA|nr:hypothetical protein CHS0354_028330 [Potamilus streckersoni]
MDDVVGVVPGTRASGEDSAYRQLYVPKYGIPSNYNRIRCMDRVNYIETIPKRETVHLSTFALSRAGFYTWLIPKE